MWRNFSKYKFVYSHLWQTYGQSWLVRLSFIIQLASRISKLIFLPIAISIIIANLSVKDYDGAQRGVLIFVVFSLLVGIFAPLSRYIGMIGENKVYRESTAKYFEKLLESDLDFFNSNMSGYLTTATRQYVDGGVQLVRSLRAKYLTTILSILFPLAVILWLDTKLGLITLILSLIQAFYLIWASHKINPYRTKSREQYKAHSGFMSDIISNILAVKSTAQEKNYVKQIKINARNESNVFYERYKVQSQLIATREVITVIFFMVLLWLTVQAMKSDSISIAGAVLIVTYTTTILGGIYSLSEDLDEHDDFVDKIIPASEVLDRKNNINDPNNPITFKNIKGDICFKNVSFAYSEKDTKEVFSGFNLQIPNGQKIGVVGLSGAGKSTLTKLLLRFNDPTSGSITIDDIDIKSIAQHDLRSNISYVPQEPLLFHDSIKENILMGDLSATDQDIINALKIAHGWEFVSKLPAGIDSIVGERGVKLSGGQKQRIAIARSVLRHTPIIILDEATSALDSESEQIIKESFKDIFRDKTAIVVAHRLSTLSDMDRIIVIHDGNIAEDGNHNELIKINGLYAKLWERQQKNQI